MTTFEVDFGDAFENPVGDLAAKGVQTRNTAQLLPEYEETDDNLAQAVMTEDLFDVITESFSSNAGRSRMEESERRVTAIFKDIKDWEAPIQKKELKQMLEASLHVTISNTLLADLLRQIDVDGDDSVTAREFEAWFKRQMQMTEQSVESIDPHQAQLKRLQSQTLIIDPNSNFRGNWDMIQAALLMYIAVVVPYRIGFNHNVELWSLFFFFDLCIDIYFVIDLCLNFRTAVITPEGEIMYTPKDIAENYARGWFPIDFVSCLPFSYAEYFVTADDAGGDGSNNRAVRLLRLIRLLKLLRLVRIKRILDRWEEEMYGASMLKFGKLIFLIFAASHWVACLWYAVGAPPEFEDQVERDISGKQLSGWVEKKYPTHIVDEDGLNRTLVHTYMTKYVDALWWASMSVLMVSTEVDGADDEWNGLPELYWEKIIYGLAMIAGAFIMSVLIGSMSDIISHSNPGDKRRHDEIGVVKGFLHERKMPPMLARRVRAHFSLLYTMRGTTADFRGFFDLMPREMANELAANMRFIDDVKTGRLGLMHNVPFLNTLEVEDLIRIGCRLRPHRAHPPVVDEQDNPIGGQIMKEGVRGTEMWIVFEGEVRIERGGADAGTPRQQLGKLRFGEYFGELAVLIEETRGIPVPYTRSAYAATSNCVLMVLSHWDMISLRRESDALDAAVVRAAHKIKMAKPSLFGMARNAEDGQGNVGERLTRLEEKMDQILSVIGKQATDDSLA